MKTIREMLHGKDIWWGVVALLILANVIGFAWYALVTGKTLKEIEVIRVELFSILTLLIGYRWGSSKGSKDKDKNTTA